MKTLLLSSLFALSLIPGIAAAQSSPTPAGAVPMGGERPALIATPDAPAATSARNADAIDHLCLRETGTLIRPRAERASAKAARERCPSHVYGRVWTQDDLRSTGQIDIAQALRMLDPSIR